MEQAEHVTCQECISAGDRGSVCKAGQHLIGGRGAVMSAFAMHLLATTPGLQRVDIHPDGEHAKRFNFSRWLERLQFFLAKQEGKNLQGGRYVSASGKEIYISFKSGLGDVVADFGNRRIVAECKGGIINTTHSGQTSRLRKGLCEAIGQSFSIPVAEGTRQFAVVPRTKTTVKLANQIWRRAKNASIEIALIDRHGSVHEGPEF